MVVLGRVRSVERREEARRLRGAAEEANMMTVTEVRLYVGIGRGADECEGGGLYQNRIGGCVLVLQECDDEGCRGGVVG